MNSADPKMFAKLVAEVLIHGARLRFADRGGASIEEIEDFCRERAANIAQALPELIEESTPPEWYKAEIAKLPASIAAADRIVAALVSK